MLVVVRVADPVITRDISIAVQLDNRPSNRQYDLKIRKFGSRYSIGGARHPSHGAVNNVNEFANTRFSGIVKVAVAAVLRSPSTNWFSSISTPPRTTGLSSKSSTGPGPGLPIPGSTRSTSTVVVTGAVARLTVHSILAV